MAKTMRIGLVGAGMFGGDVHLRAYADLERSGIAPYLGRLGMDAFARPLADARFELAAVATRTPASAARAADAYAAWTGRRPAAISGEEPWRELLDANVGLDILAVATPDHLHVEPTCAALECGAHVILEKPMCLDMGEADRIVALARERQRVVCLDMHKRYDPDHMRVRNEILTRIGPPLYGLAYLEEPLEVSTSTFQWVERSDPFSYVGPHWVDLFIHYFGARPVGVSAVGQKARLVRQGIDAFDAVQVRVDWDNGMSIAFHNNWITPSDFEGPVNQGHEVVGADGKVESDQQYRGFRFWSAGGGSRTANNHFTRDVPRPAGSPAYVGYGTDSIHAGVLAACRVSLLGEPLSAVRAHYPTPEEGRLCVAVVQAARLVRDRNWKHMAAGRSPAATASLGADGIRLLDPHRALEGPEAVSEVVYDRPV